LRRRFRIYRSDPLSDEKTADKPTEIKRPALRLFEKDLKRAEFAFTIYDMDGKPGYSPEDYAQPEAYANMTTLRAKDHLFVMAEDKTWFADILVLDVSGPGRVAVALLHKFSFERDDEAAHEDYEVKFAGAAKWRVHRKSDNHVMVSGLGTKSEAVGWIETNAKAPLKQAA
jgi:hypothetical protein